MSFGWDDISEKDVLWWWASICSRHRQRDEGCSACKAGCWVCIVHNEIGCEKCFVEKED